MHALLFSLSFLLYSLRPKFEDTSQNCTDDLDRKAVYNNVCTLTAILFLTCFQQKPW